MNDPNNCVMIKNIKKCLIMQILNPVEKNYCIYPNAKWHGMDEALEFASNITREFKNCHMHR